MASFWNGPRIRPRRDLRGWGSLRKGRRGGGGGGGARQREVGWDWALACTQLQLQWQILRRKGKERNLITSSQDTSAQLSST